MIRTALLALFALSTLFASNSCVKCHEGIEAIRDPASKMMQEIYAVSEKAGHGGNDCIVCHGGNPNSMVKERAHNGTASYFKSHKGPKAFYPAPGSPRINEHTCGMCHREQVMAQNNTLMQTEQGIIQGALWGFGALEGQEHGLGTNAVKNPEDPHMRLGTQQYRAYMEKLAALEPQVFSKETAELPSAPTVDEVEKDPQLAVYTYLRQACLQCHTGTKGYKERSGIRGIGCASCHIPYAGSGLYEGGDKTIKKEPGHLLVHTLQSSRKAKVKVGDIEYSGVPVQTCAACHSRGKHIGSSYQGLAETPQSVSFDAHGGFRRDARQYIHMQEDVHYKKGMLCQDCHTSNDLHGDGFLGGTTLASVEIECQDCHGTTKAYPWELPLGYSDEFNTTSISGKGRGTSMSLAAYLEHGTHYDAKEGYLLSARGNPLPNVVKEGKSVIVHLAGGKDIKMKPLKALKEEERLSIEALAAMDSIAVHTDRMECYACHAVWAPQYYGGHVKIDYSGGKKNVDRLAASHEGNLQGANKGTRGREKYLIDGEVTESRFYLRWEEPPLSQNGEGRISPTIPAYQAAVTVVGKKGIALLKNHVFKVPNAEDTDEAERTAITMSPVQPHTTAKRSRSCESCHSSAKAMGYGIGAGELGVDLSKERTLDLMTADKRVIPARYDLQTDTIANLHDDWSRYVDENGTRLQTIGHHWGLAAPLDETQRAHLDRRGVCLACHKVLPAGDLGTSAMVHVSQMLGVKVDKELHGMILNNLLRISAWAQVAGGVLITTYIIYRLFFRRKKQRRWR
jgi:hypothetical protein